MKKQFKDYENRARNGKPILDNFRGGQRQMS